MFRTRDKRHKKRRESCNAAKLAVDMSDTIPANHAVRKSTHPYAGVMSAVKGHGNALLAGPLSLS
jgi:hypothetical protein